jgi:DNA helicase-2/ATP-dependent DNA helicase PcrA
VDLSHLNAPQAEAVRTTEGPLLVLAGAGSGKTRVIAHRVAYLLAVKHVPARQILAVTFTNKAAGEMKERIGALAASVGGRGTARGLTVTTFHAFGAEVLRADGDKLGLSRRFGIADAGDQISIIKRALRESRVDDRAFDARRVLALISKAKCAGVEPQPMAEGLGDDYDVITALVYPRYQQSLRALGLIDFDDLLILPVRLFSEHVEVRNAYVDRYRYLLVDEYQDTSRTQFQLLHHLAGLRRNLCVVGDDDQSIYGWRGAEVSNILDFHLAYPGTREVYLEQNYRSTHHVLSCANAVIARNPERKPKRLWTDRGEGERVQVVACPDDDAEAEYIAREIESALKGGRRPRDIAILYRTSAQSRPIEEALRARSVPYVVTGGQEFFDRREVKDLLAYLRAAVNPDDELSLLRIVNVPPRGIGEVTVQRLAQHAGAEKMPLWEAFQRAAEWDDLPAGAGARVLQFAEMLRTYRKRFEAEPPTPVVQQLVEELQLRVEARRSAASLEAGERRVRAIDQVLEGIDRYQQKGKGDLGQYLRQLALDSGDEDDDPGNRVVLSTLHAAKGLEWPVVFLCGCEEDLLPHRGMQGEPPNIEEERRLAYVGITRARERLVASYAKGRLSRGKLIARPPSRFLADLPAESHEVTDLDAPPRDSGPEREQDFLQALRLRLRAGPQPPQG